MNYKPIIVVAGEPNSIFSEIYLKSINSKKFKSPIVLIASHNLIKLQMKKLNLSKKIRLIKFSDLKDKSLNNKKINLINISLIKKRPLIKYRVNRMTTLRNHLMLHLKF